MKLSEMSTDKAMEVMANMIPAVSRIMSNERIASIFDEKPEKEANGIKFFFDLIVVLLRECRADTVEIVGLLCGKTTDQVRQQSIIDTVKDLRSCYDKELIDFFTSLRPSRQAS